MSLVQMSLSAGGLILLIVLVRALGLHRLPKRLFVGLWGLAALRLLLPYTLPSRFSVLNLLSRGRAAATVSFWLPVATVPGGTSATAAAGAAAESQPVLFWVWLAGALGLTLFFAATHWRCRVRFRASLPAQGPALVVWRQAHPAARRVRVRVTDRVRTPLTYGLLRPVILLPCDMARDETHLPTVLTHEWTHIRHGDALKKGVLAAALCLHWFNPLVWVMFVLAGRDIELACDESVVGRRDMQGKAGYARALLVLEEQRGHAAPLANHFSKYALEERIVSIMKSKRISLPALLAVCLMLALAVTLFATTASAQGAEAGTRAIGATEEQVYQKAVKDWEAFGLRYDELRGTYHYLDGDQSVCFFMDNHSGNALKFSGTVYDYRDSGTLHLVARRAGDGTLTAIEEITAEEADKLAVWRP